MDIVRKLGIIKETATEYQQEGSDDGHNPFITQ